MTLVPNRDNPKVKGHGGRGPVPALEPTPDSLEDVAEEICKLFGRWEYHDEAATRRRSWLRRPCHVGCRSPCNQLLDLLRYVEAAGLR